MAAKLIIVLALVLVAGAGGAGCAARPDGRAALAPPAPGLQGHTFARLLMGVRAQVTLFAPDRPTAAEAAGAALDRVAALEEIMSDWREQSEVMRLSREAHLGPRAVSPDLWRVLARAVEVHEASEGAFDVTIGEHSLLWREARRRGEPPTREHSSRIARGRLVLEGGRVAVEGGPVRIDLGGIAKGDALDQAAAVLREHGIDHYLLDLGGDLLAGAPPPGRDAWRVRVETPLEEDLELRIAGGAVATSGDRYQSMEAGGGRLSHVLDPREGWPVSHPRTVVVVAPEGITADAWASAISVLGEPGLELLEDGVEALIVEASDEGWRAVRSAGWAW